MTKVAFMYLMIKEMSELNATINRSLLQDLGKDVDLFKGVDTWFDRMNEYAASLDLEVEHYIISSGLKEIIEGTSIADKFKKVFACEFLYDTEGNAVWPAQAINYTTKTQFIFRINKGIFDVSQIREINTFVPYNERRIPFENMIYIGDGITDIPSMKVVKVNGGTSIAVFKEGQKESVESLVRDKRVNFCAPSDYSVDSHIEHICKSVLQKIANEQEQRSLREKISFSL